MAIVAGSLADGQLPAVKGTLLTVGTGRAAHMPHAIFVNTDSVARTINLYVKRSGSSSRRVIAVNTSINAGERLLVDWGTTGLKLSAGDLVEGDASAANVVDYFLSGGTESA